MDIYSDLAALYTQHNYEIHPTYGHIMQARLATGLAYTSPVMVGLIETLLRNKAMMAYNLLQNAIDEAKGAARVHLIADRYAPADLKREMFQHAGDELRHSRLFAHLVTHTGFEYEEATDSDATGGTVDDVFDFDDSLRPFLCRVHSIEVRSWVMLRHYLHILGQFEEDSVRGMITTIEQIRDDEIRHVLYTGKWVNRWCAEDPALPSILEECVAHTNRETWHDLASMASYMASAMDDVMQSEMMPTKQGGRWNRCGNA